MVLNHIVPFQQFMTRVTLLILNPFVILLRRLGVLIFYCIQLHLIQDHLAYTAHLWHLEATLLNAKDKNS
jgi:hypothetical protein